MLKFFKIVIYRRLPLSLAKDRLPGDKEACPPLQTNKDKDGSWVDYLHAIGRHCDYYLDCFMLGPIK